MNKKKFTYITALTLLSFTLMTGCTNERKENQTAYRQIGINAMESGKDVRFQIFSSVVYQRSGADVDVISNR